MAEARLDAMLEQQKKMKRELERANDFAKNLMVEQAEGRVQSLADKRAVGYLVEEQYQRAGERLEGGGGGRHGFGSRG